MSVSIRLKHSATKDKAPQPSDLSAGELAVNTHQDSPALYLKDAAGVVRKIAGAGAIGGTAATESAAGIAELATQAETNAGTDDQRIVTPLKLKTALDTLVPDASETASGKVELATAAETTAGADSTKAVHPAGLKVELDKKANLASPALTGTPTAPTAASGTNTTQLATTAFVAAATADATASTKGVVQLADAAAVTAGTAGRVVDAAQLKAAVDAEDLWDRTGTEISPKVAGDSVFTSGAVKVGGTTAAPLIQLKADGTAHFEKGAKVVAVELDNAAGNIGNVHIYRKTAVATDKLINFYSDISATGTGVCSLSADGSLDLGATAAGAKFKFNAATGDFLLGGTMPASPAVKLLGASGTAFFSSGRVAITDNGPTQVGIGTIGSLPFRVFTNSDWFIAGVQLAVGATDFGPATSESRLKDIQSGVDTDQCWTLIRDIELKRYYYKDQDDKSGVSYMGPMADWLGVQDPELLIDTGRTDEHGPIHTYNQGLLDMKALAALSAALKRIEDLEAKVAALQPTLKSTDPGAK